MTEDPQDPSTWHWNTPDHTDWPPETEYSADPSGPRFHWDYELARNEPTSVLKEPQT